ncbi:hypothetical protein [Pseudomonas nitroreducens]|uniref:hypothetical protein n=1 Tax=Pseudomonas nitroreducens TaxID=46680 RepID=UPI001FB651C5|nr:hypothetical protein [Pseudomonas nitroreducens]MCJ1879667.1 hypothetical protein [Pseudomonas nitroreducens]MCJ1896828.1 hypothetical protein [Pseudomonas nitroreducens]
MSEKPLKAYHVGEGSEGEHVIVFATSGAAGRRKGGNELNLEFDEVEFCRRAPWADEFAGQRFIPAKAYHQNGWWLYCNHCETRLYEDAEDEDGNPRQLVYDGQHAYCDQACKDGHEREIADANAKGEAFKAKALHERPYLTFTKWNIGWPRITQSAEYTFPGGKYGGSVRDEGDGQLQWYIAQADQEAWNTFQALQAA